MSLEAAAEARAHPRLGSEVKNDIGTVKQRSKGSVREVRLHEAE
jgi:hypothetical protein